MTSGKQHALRVETSRPWLLAGLFWFILIVVLGILMRLSLAFDAPLPGAFEWVRHAHSHTAFWGWAGSAFTGIMLSGLSSGRHSDVRFERRLFLATQCCTAGALFSFISSGYSAVSIVFSALHVGLWFVLAIHVRRRGFSDMLASATRQLMLLALVCLLVAALPTFFLPVSVATGMGGPLLKKMAIEFFLHNYSEGWLLLMACALLLERANPAPVIRIPAALVFVLVVTGAFRGVLPELSPEVALFVRVASLLWGVLQVMLVLQLYRVQHGLLSRLAVATLFLKGLFDIAVVVPDLTELMLAQPVTVLYLHLKLLGVVSLSLIIFAQQLLATTSQRLNILLGAGTAGTIIALFLIAWPAFATWMQLDVASAGDSLWFAGQIAAAVSAMLVGAGVFVLLRKRKME